jgi:hypothetical protein
MADIPLRFLSSPLGMRYVCARGHVQRRMRRAEHRGPSQRSRGLCFLAAVPTGRRSGRRMPESRAMPPIRYEITDEVTFLALAPGAGLTRWVPPLAL